MKKLWGLSAALVFFLVSCEPNRIAGTTDETETSISGKVSYAGGNSAGQAKVSIFKDTATTPLAKITADNSGNYKFSKLNSGRYSVWAEGNDSVVAYADSVYVPEEKQVIRNLMLEKSGSITAFIKLQPNHDPRTVTVNALGTQKYANVNAAGAFTVKGLAPGEYTLRLLSTEPDYTPTFTTVGIESGKNDTLKDTIELIYTGIPVVTGLKATFDTVAGVVTFSWDKTKYWDFQEYLIYRDPFDKTILSTQAIASRNEPLFSDSLLKNGYFLPTDTTSLHLKYRVSIRSNTGDAGVPYGKADVWVVPPTLLKMRFSFVFRDSISAHVDTVVVFGKYSSPVGALVKSVQWKDLGSDTLVSSKIIIPQTAIAYDTVTWVPKAKGMCRLECSVADTRGIVWKDTVSRNFVPVTGGIPTVVASWTFDSVAFNAYYDVTGHGVTLLGSGTGLALSAGVKGLALNCPGAGYELVASNTRSAFNRTRFSFECWYNSSIDPKTQISGAAALLNFQNTIVSGVRNGYAVYINSSGNVVFGMATKDGNAYVNAVSTTGLNAEQWYHIVATYDSTNLKIYVNGVLENSAQNYSGGYPAPGADARIGCQRLDANTVQQFLNGKIDEINYYNYALPSDSVAAHYRMSAAPFPSDQYTVALWHFDEGTGDSVYDASGNGNHGRINGAQWTQGRFASALSFSGDDSVNVIDKPSLHVQAVTIEAWVYSDNFGAAQHGVIVSKEYGGMASYRIQNYDGVGRVSVVTDNNWGYNAVTSHTLSNGAWHYVAGVAANGYLKVYIDGILAASAQRTIAMSYDDSPLLIGAVRKYANECFRGIIDEVRISSIDRFAR